MNDTIQIDSNIDYLGPDREEKLDVYYSMVRTRGTKFPGLIVIHGGGFFSQSKSGARESAIASGLAAEGYVCASIDYKLVDFDSPETATSVWPTVVHDCKRAVRFLRDNSDRFGVDSDHIGVIGGSAGGYLAAMLACTTGITDFDPEPGPAGIYSVQCAVVLYGMGDISHRLMNATVQRKGMQAFTMMMGGTIDEYPERYRAASPVKYADAEGPPMLLIHGTGDEVIPSEESEHFAAELKTRGAPHALILVDGAPHTFYRELFIGDLRRDLLDFLNTNLKLSS